MIGDPNKSHQDGSEGLQVKMLQTISTTTFTYQTQDSLEELNRKKKQLREAQEKLKSVHDDLQQKKQKKAELENEVDLCRLRPIYF